MEIDRALLLDSGRIEHDGVVERVAYLPVGADRCWTDLYLPAGEPASTGFVVCHAYGLELLWLHRIERGISRALAAAGFPVLAIHRRGFGDSTGETEDATLARQAEDVCAGIDHLAAETGAQATGLIAARFGAMVAAGVLRERPVNRLMLMNPVLDGAAYLREMIRNMGVVGLAMGLQDRPRTLEAAGAEVERDGVLDVLGQPIHRRLFEELLETDVTAEVASYAGDALVCQISKTSTLGRPVQELASGMQAAGGRCRTAVLREPVGGSFGHSSQVRAASEVALKEVLIPLEEELAETAVSWART